MSKPLAGDSRIPSLDGLRAISILMVVGGHLALSRTAPSLFARVQLAFDAELGVRVFFVISGFLITSLLVQESGRYGRISLSRFYLRRAFRLLPVQWSFLIALFALTRVTPLTVTPCQWATSLSYTKNYACSSWVDGHLWSLSVEEQFYLLWPAILAFLPRRLATILALGLIAVAPISRAIEYEHASRQFVWLLSNTDALMPGCLLALWMPAVRAHVRPAPASTRAAILMALLLAIWMPEWLRAHLLLGWFTVTLGPLIQGAAIAWLVFELTERPPRLASAVLEAGPVRWLGRLSYSLYLWQQIFFAPPQVFGWTTAPILLRFPGNTIAPIAAASCSYYALERPLQGLRRRLHRPPPAPDVPRPDRRLAGGVTRPPEPAPSSSGASRSSSRTSPRRRIDG